MIVKRYSKIKSIKFFLFHFFGGNFFCENYNGILLNIFKNNHDSKGVGGFLILKTVHVG